jgi:FkbM family methyltransferase
MAPFVNKFGFWDSEISDFLSRQLNKSKTKQIFIDIGANQGLITLQVLNKLSQFTNCEVICVEPVRSFFNNLQKNIQGFNSPIVTHLFNFGLSNSTNMEEITFVSKRNATSTQHKKLSFDTHQNLIQERVKLVSVSEFIEKYLNSRAFENIVIKSDTDGTDLVIFDSFINSKIGSKIQAYALEIILNGTTATNVNKMLKNCSGFSEWTLISRNGLKYASKEEIFRLLNTTPNFMGDLFLVR